MCKRYATQLSNGHRIETSSPHEARNVQNYDGAQLFFLGGEPVSAAAFYADAGEACAAAWAKKEQTHRRASVLFGSSSSRVTKWVRK